MKRKTLTLLGLLSLSSLSLALLLAFSTRWYTAIVGGISLLSGLAGSLLVLITLGALALAQVRRSARPRRIGRVSLLVGIFLLLQLVYIPTAGALRNRQVRQAQEFVESLVPRLEAYKHQYGTYPTAVEAILSDDDSPPSLLQLRGDFPMQFDNRSFYFHRGTTVGFRFYLPDGFIGFSYEYCCGPNGKWTVTD